jgi:hypothetical protein
VLPAPSDLQPVAPSHGRYVIALPAASASLITFATPG